MPQVRLTILDPLLAREFEVPLGVTIIGREPSTNLPIANTQVSRRHAQLVSDGKICELIDLGSANGTFVNDTRLTPQAPVTLEDGMRLRFGPVEISVAIIPDAPVETQAEAPDQEIPVGAPLEAPSDRADEPIPADTPVNTSTLPEEELVLDLPVEPSTPKKAHRDAPRPEEEPASAQTPAVTSALPDQAPEDLLLDLPVEPATPEGAHRDAPRPEEEPAPAKPDTPQAEAEPAQPPPDDAPPPTQTPDQPIMIAQPVEIHGPNGHDGSQPPRPPSSTPWLDGVNLPENPFGLPGLSIYSQCLIRQLPGIYQTDFMARFLGIFESIQTPIEWTVDSFDLYLDPDTSPAAFLSWLGSWYGLIFDASWNEEQRRMVIREAYAIFSRRGTRWALARILQIYTGCDPLIADTGDNIEPFTFRVRLALPDTQANRTLLTRLIDAHKPAFTTYRLELMP